MTSYYLYCSYPKKGQNPSYAKYKKEHMPFYWDVINHAEVDSVDSMDAEQPISPDEWAQRIAGMTKATKQDPNKVQSI